MPKKHKIFHGRLEAFWETGMERIYPTFVCEEIFVEIESGDLLIVFDKLDNKLWQGIIDREMFTIRGFQWTQYGVSNRLEWINMFYAEDKATLIKQCLPVGIKGVLPIWEVL